MFNEDDVDLSELAYASRNTQWTDYSRPESARLQKELAQILNSHLFGALEVVPKTYEYDPPALALAQHNKKDTRSFSKHVIAALASGEHSEDQVCLESWALGILIGRLPAAKRARLMNEMFELVASGSSLSNQKDLMLWLGTESYGDLTSSVVVSDDLEYGEVMKEQRSEEIVRRAGFVPVPSLY